MIRVSPCCVAAFRDQIDAIGVPLNQPNLFADVCASLDQATAFLFLSPEGFCVLAPKYPDKVLVWVAHSFAPAPRARIQRELEQLARAIGAKSIELWSARAGFARVLPRLGYTARPDHWRGTPVTVWTKTL